MTPPAAVDKGRRRRRSSYGNKVVIRHEEMGYLSLPLHFLPGKKYQKKTKQRMTPTQKK